MNDDAEKTPQSTKPNVPHHEGGVSGRKFVMISVLIGIVLYVIFVVIARIYGGGFNSYFN